MKYYSTLKFGLEHSYHKPWGSECYPNGCHTYAVYHGGCKVGEIGTARCNRYSRAGENWEVEPYTPERSTTIGKAATLFEAKQLFAQHYKPAPKTDTNVVSYLADPNAEFYPTPENLAGKMFRYIKDHRNISTVLEPSAGKGDLAELYLRYLNKHSDNKGWHRRDYNADNIDMIEKDSNLIALLRGKNYRIVGDDFLAFNPPQAL